VRGDREDLCSKEFPLLPCLVVRAARNRSDRTNKEPSMTGQAQRLPVRLYQTDERFMIAAPMPGLEPEDISVTIHRDRLVVHGEERGPGQHEQDLLLAEWSVGPYRREIELPAPVDGPLVNASYGNGVLVVTAPKASGQASTSAHVQLRTIRATRGERVGHRGKDVTPIARGDFDGDR
jgi:HSP20 family protein